MRAEADRFTRERRELSEQIQEAESQLEWLRSDRDDEIGKLIAEKKVLQDRLHDSETQLSQLKCRKRDELKVSVCLLLINDSAAVIWTYLVIHVTIVNLAMIEL